MRSYLGLVARSARARRGQNRLTVLCIALSVFLVTAIFTTADMGTRAELEYMKEKHGSWHLRLEGISGEEGAEIAARNDVTSVGWCQSFNLEAEDSCLVNGKRAALYGVDESYLVGLRSGLEEGAYPETDGEAVLSGNARLALGVEPGDTVLLETAAGTRELTVSGLGSDDREYFQGQNFLVGVYLTPSAFGALLTEIGVPVEPSCYVEFESPAAASRAEEALKSLYGLGKGDLAENTAVLGISGVSGSRSLNGSYQAAAVLFVLVLLAGVLMISGSLHTNVAQRTQYFGMLRCIGASRRQILRLVRLEALGWCRTAVPAGLVLGTAVSWMVCALLRGMVGNEFAHMPVFALSPVGLAAGAVVGTATVLLAARAPARRAAQVSPVVAVSGAVDEAPISRGISRLGTGGVERTLGIRHATASKKNWLLTTASFALSMLLLLAFSVALDFAREVLPTLCPWQPDVTLNGYGNARVLSPELGERLRELPGVKNVYGTSYRTNVPAVCSREGVSSVHLASCDRFLLECARDCVLEGDLSAVLGEGGGAMIVRTKDNPLQVGDTVCIGEREIPIVCAISSGVWDSRRCLFCSEETFQSLTGERDYSLMGLQVEQNVPEDLLERIGGMIGDDVILDDLRAENASDRTLFLGVQIMVYGFTALVALISLINIASNVTLSVTARRRQYGVMRAVGMDGSQLKRMVAAEACTSVISGLAAGCALGLPLSMFLHARLVTRYFGTPWRLPVAPLVVIALFDLLAVILAVHVPVKRLREMEITAVIGDL